MGDEYCRLCLSREKCLNIFNPELTNSEQLRMCILLCTGVNILLDDIVTKNVCHTCCEISIKLFKFRKNALANDKALKGMFRQDHITVPTDINNTVQINEFLVKKTGVKIRFGDELKKKLPTARRTKRYAVHPSIFKLLKRFPRIKLPDELITVNCDPRIYAENLDGTKLESLKGNIKLPTAHDVDIAIFKQKFPGISIVKVSGDDGPIQKDSLQTNVECKSDLGDENINEIEHQNREEKQKEVPVNRKRKLEEEVKEVKKAKTIDESTVDLKIPEPSPKIKDFLESLQLYENKDNRLTKTNEESRKELPEATEEDTNLENLEISMLMTNTYIEPPALQEPLQEEPLEMSTIISDADTDTDSEEVHINRKVLRPRKSRPSFFENEAIFDDSDDDYVPDLFEPDEDDDMDETENCSLLQTVDEEMTFACDICNKMFDHPTKLKLHKHMHKDCIVCKKTFTSQKALNYHLNETCYKRIIANPPILCLNRCEAEVKPTTSKSADTDFEVLCISDDDEPQPTTKQSTRSFQMDFKEQQRISQVFEKYYMPHPPYHKSVACHENAQLYAATMSKGQATMNGMYPILKYFRIPVVLTAGDAMRVHMTDKIIDLCPKNTKTADWIGYPIKNLSQFAHAKMVGGRQIVPKPTASSQQDVANTSTTNTMSLTLGDLLNSIPAANAPAKVNTANNIVTNAPPIILNTLQKESAPNPQSIVLNNVSKESILAVQVAPQLKIKSILNTNRQPQLNTQTKRTLSALVPKTYKNKSRPPPYQAAQAQSNNAQSQNMISQVQNIVTQPQAITIQQPTQAYFRTPTGYILSTTQSTFTTPTNQTTFSSVPQSTFNPIYQTTFPTINQNTINHNQAFAITNTNILAGASINSYKTLAPTSVNNLPSKQALTTQSVQNNEHINAPPNVVVANAENVTNGNVLSCVPTTLEQAVTQSTQKDVQPQQQIVCVDNQLQIISVDDENSQKQPQAVPTKRSNSEGVANYIRVKAPWELNGL